MQFIEVRLSELLRALVGREGKAKSARFSVFQSRGLFPIILIVSLVAFSAVRARATENPAAELQAQVCPMLDDLTEASISVAMQDRSSASTQVGSIISLADGLISTVQSPDMISALGKSAKSLQKAFLRFQGRLEKAKVFLDDPAVADATALQAMLAAVSEGQRLRKTMLKVPASDTVVTVRETATRGIALHYSGEVVCFHVDIRNDNGTPSCGQAEVSVDVLDGDPAKTVIVGLPSFKGPNDFCLTLGPDGGTVRVSVTVCGQANSILLYNYGVPKKAGKTGRAPKRPSNLAIMGVTPTVITLNWQDNSNDEAGFRIQRALSAAGPWELAGTVGANVTSFTDSGLVASTTYYYRVLAFN
jgi:hypothetical protein